MNKSEKTGEKEILIEICQNCRLHRWCTRHDEKKYNMIFENVSKALIKELGSNYKVLKNPNISKPRIGAFEVTLENKVIFSKIAKGCFPDPAFVAAKAKEISEGKNIEKKGEQNIEKKPKKKLNVTVNKSNEAGDFKIPKYDIICPSPTKIHRAYNFKDSLIMEQTNEPEKKTTNEQEKKN